MDHERLLTLTQIQIERSQAYVDESLSALRKEAWDRYLMAPLGNETEGRSKVQTSDVLDTVEWVMPSLLRIFLGGDEIVSIEPQQEGDKESAKVAEAWVNYVLTRENDGHTVLHDVFKDGLISGVGAVKTYWDHDVELKVESYEGLSQEELDTLRDDDELTIQHVEEYDAGDGTMLYDVRVARQVDRYRLKIEAIPADELLVEDGARNLDAANFIAQKSRMTISELRELGYDVPDDVDGKEISGSFTLDRQARQPDLPGGEREDDELAEADPSLRHVWVYECYVRSDQDGDGIAEWYQVIRLADRILSAEPIDKPRIRMFSPVRVPHRWIGFGMANLVAQLQELKTALVRSVLDHIYQTSEPLRELVMTGVVDETVEDLMDGRLGGYVRVGAPGTINPVPQPPMNQWVLQMLEYTDMMRENRTGVTRYNQGLHADTLNPTATGIMQIMNAAGQRLEMLARLIADQLFKPMVQDILELTADYPEYTRERIIRLTDQPVGITGAVIKGGYDIVINVGIGTGNRDQKLGHLSMLLQIVQQAVAMGAGPESPKPLVTWENLYNMLSSLVKTMGFKTPSDFFTKPDPRPTPQMPNPQMVEAMSKAKEREAKIMLEQKKLELEERKLQLQEAELNLKATEVGARVASEADRARKDGKRATGDS